MQCGQPSTHDWGHKAHVHFILTLTAYPRSHVEKKSKVQSCSELFCFFVETGYMELSRKEVKYPPLKKKKAFPEECPVAGVLDSQKTLSTHGQKMCPLASNFWPRNELSRFWSVE